MVKKITKPWGFEEVIFSGINRKVKMIHLLPRCRLSRQLHQHREEIFYCLSGGGLLEKETCLISLSPELTIPLMISPREVHRLINPGKIPLVVLEIQSGKCDDSDIERLEDDYGRS